MILIINPVLHKEFRNMLHLVFSGTISIDQLLQGHETIRIVQNGRERE